MFAMKDLCECWLCFSSKLHSSYIPDGLLAVPLQAL